MGYVSAKKRTGSRYAGLPRPAITAARSAAKSASAIAPVRTSGRGRQVSKIVGIVMACAPRSRPVPTGPAGTHSSGGGSGPQGEGRQSAASSRYASIGGQVHTRLRSP